MQTSKKILIIPLIIILAPFIGGIYGILHDQLTYTISPEYYTKFKFDQFEIAGAIPDRMKVAIVGFMATWWMGLPIGLILGLAGLIHRDWKTMLGVTLKAFAVAMLVAFATGLLGLVYAQLFLVDKTHDRLNWYIPDNVHDVRSFIVVGSIHNFSYLGGLAGLIAGLAYSIRKKRVAVYKG